ncbi:chemotaxis protein CheA [Pseudoblastomonas halimionae]|uniref:Chemotaxis protein CheA n=1 Tax=Alteriqipengyuania halimionae TaxID=1926630 RepID=A0A6I4U583_9SPHN|nr:chemotaxis protein CheA [Alteriqipengyuania halimionae]MXP11150.1 chemotaxis protein CheA [Alteriqipengyuania halimionae]
MDELLADFVAETREMLEKLGGELVAWEADPTESERLDAIFRFVHTVKGNCGFFDLPQLAELSHAAEDALADCRSGERQADEKLVSAVLAIVDRISAMIDAIDAGEEIEGDDDALIDALAPGATEAEPVICVEEVRDAVVADQDKPAAKQAAAARSIRLPVDLLDRVMSGVSDMVLARNDLSRRLRESGAQPTIDGPFERLSAILADVRDAITRMRMQRIETLFSSFPRLVRDLAHELGKQVTVDLEGGEVELDREMIEMIRDPLTHIIRNAIDHGIEAPAERLAKGKRESGMLRISARQAGNRISIAIEDDGKGIDGARVLEKAIEKGIVSASEGARYSTTQRQRLIFEPGLSTATEVSGISGRGVGMDVVRANIERVGGSIEVESDPGEGTRIFLRLPLTLSIIPALTVETGGQRFAIPRSAVVELVSGRRDNVDFARVGDSLLAELRGRRVACLRLADVLGVEGEKAAEDGTLVLLRLPGGDLFAISVDQILDHEELVVKPIAPAVMATGLYAGTTLLDDGSPVLLLDIAGLARGVDLEAEARHREEYEARQEEQRAEKPREPVLLFVGVDGRRRAIRMEIVCRIESVPVSAIDVSGGGAQVVLGEDILPLAGLGGAEPESVAKNGRVGLFRVGDGRTELTYAFSEMIDTAQIEHQIITSESTGEIEGLTLIGGEPTELVDAHWLFARHARSTATGESPVCRLPLDDAWARQLLRPLVEAAGYRVIGEDDEGEASIALAAVENGEGAPRAGRVIWLRETPEANENAPHSIYRYDRAGLLAALGDARSGGEA